jgi:hypothetical protein
VELASGNVLHLYDSFIINANSNSNSKNHKCSKLDTVCDEGLKKVSNGNENLKIGLF